MKQPVKELSISEIVKKVSLLRESAELGPVRITWREPKPGGKIIFSVIAKKETDSGRSK